MKKNVALVDIRIPECASDILTDYGYIIIRVPRAGYLAPPVASHPDMVFFALGEQLFCHSRYLETPEGDNTANTIAALTDLIITPISDETGDKYPLDVRLNCAVVGNILMASPYTSVAVTEAADELGMTVIKVKQGYVKCSSAVIDGVKRGIITSDTKIASAAKKEGIETLTVPHGEIVLEGYSYGFIGGCTGFDDGRMFFTGDLAEYPYGKEVKAFLDSLSCEAVSLLPDVPFTDYGSILFI